MLRTRRHRLRIPSVRREPFEKETVKNFVEKLNKYFQSDKTQNKSKT